jgi:hypothetical protein
MKEKLVLLFFTLACFTAVLAQAPIEPGFYLTQESKKTPCGQQVKSFRKGVTYCILPRPILSASEFEFITEIRSDTITHLEYVDLWISASGLNAVKTAIEMLPDSRMVLVLDNIVAGTFTDDFIKTKTKYIRISGVGTSKEIERIHSLLQYFVKYKSREEMKAAREEFK